MHDCTTPKPRRQCDSVEEKKRAYLDINEPKEVEMNFYDLWWGPVFNLPACLSGSASSTQLWTRSLFERFSPKTRHTAQIQKEQEEEEDRCGGGGESKCQNVLFFWSCPVHAALLLPHSTCERISRFSSNSAAQTLSSSEWCWTRLQGLQRFSYFSSSASPSSPASSVWLHKSSLPPAQDWKLYLLFFF